MHSSILRNCRLLDAILEYDLGYLGSDLCLLEHGNASFPVTTVVVPTSGK